MTIKYFRAICFTTPSYLSSKAKEEATLPKKQTLSTCKNAGGVKLLITPSEAKRLGADKKPRIPSTSKVLNYRTAIYPFNTYGVEIQRGTTYLPPVATLHRGLSRVKSRRDFCVFTTFPYLLNKVKEGVLDKINDITAYLPYLPSKAKEEATPPKRQALSTCKNAEGVKLLITPSEAKRLGADKKHRIPSTPKVLNYKTAIYPFNTYGVEIQRGTTYLPPVATLHRGLSGIKSRRDFRVFTIFPYLLNKVKEGVLDKINDITAYLPYLPSKAKEEATPPKRQALSTCKNAGGVKLLITPSEAKRLGADKKHRIPSTPKVLNYRTAIYPFNTYGVEIGRGTTYLPPVATLHRGLSGIKSRRDFCVFARFFYLCPVR